jgi:hypothetical protein
MHAEVIAPEAEQWIHRQRKPTRFVTPILEHRLARRQQGFNCIGVQARQSRCQHDALSTRSGDRNGIELQVTEMLNPLMASANRARTAGAGARGQTKPFGA